MSNPAAVVLSQVPTIYACAYHFESIRVILLYRFTQKETKETLFCFNVDFGINYGRGMLGSLVTMLRFGMGK